MFEIVKCLREKSSPTASMSVEATKPEEVKEQWLMNLNMFETDLNLLVCMNAVPIGSVL